MKHPQEHIETCPICESKNLQDYLHLKDDFLSRETFAIQQCSDCNFLFTNPRPTKEAIGSYYKSDDYISHSNKSKGLFAALYQIARKLNLSSKYFIIAKHSTIGKALDIGSGTGHFLNYLQNKQWQVQGIEPDEDAAQFSRSNFSLQIDSEKKLSELDKNSFDLITMWHVLEHVHGLNERMTEIANLIKPEGLLILALPNPESFDAKHYVKYWAAYDVPRHLYHFTKETVYNLAVKHNFVVEKVFPMYLDAFYVSLLSEKYIGKKWSFLRALYIAIHSNIRNSSKNPNTSSLIYLLRLKEA